MYKNMIKAGIYKLEAPIRGDANGILFPMGSKVYINKVNGFPFKVIEGYVDGEFCTDCLSDPDMMLIHVITLQNTEGVDLTNKVERTSYLRKE